MSGIISDAAGAFGYGNNPADEVSIRVGGTSIVGWETVSISRSVESYPNAFVVTAADQFPNDAAKATVFPTGPGEPCQIYIGADLILTGYVDSYGVNIGPGHHDVTITGRGLGADFFNSSADLLASPQLRGATISASNALDLAQKLAKPFGITCRSAVADLGPTINAFSIGIGETSFEIVERVCRYAQFLVYEDQNGALVLDQVGTNKMASGFQFPGNIESAGSTLSFNQRFSTYAATFSSIMQYSEYSPISENIAYAVDTAMPSWRYRPKIIISEQVDPSQTLAQKRVDWEKARRIGRSQAIHLTCDSWRDTAGKLWQPNYLAPINAPALKITNAQWLIGEVVFRKDRSGTHADLVLMPPAAFNPEPVALTLWDRETMNSVAQGGASLPPATQH